MQDNEEGDEDGGAGGANGNIEGEPLASRKALRSEDPNYKSAEVLRCVCVCVCVCVCARVRAHVRLDTCVYACTCTHKVAKLQKCKQTK